MTQVDFYLLKQTPSLSRQLVACKIAEKAFRAHQPVFILVDSPREASQMDDLLWTFRPGSFLPHATTATTPSEPFPIVIGTLEPATAPQVLINLSQRIPASFDQAARVIEIIEDAEEQRQLGRQRYRAYSQHGITPVTHTLT